MISKRPYLMIRVHGFRTAAARLPERRV